ncbi:Ppx/GppA phosphatase family protein [Nocardia tengchongensis]|uniref:Ppx/GppA phosphatase family protein n=1 Tax=Nocardia tengchongensis TaxID=2055889 RepID=UPI00369B92B5
MSNAEFAQSSATDGRPAAAGHERIAAIDCGTNSIRLLIADATHDDAGAPRLTDVHREMRIVRLGQGVDATGALNPEAIERTRVALRDYVDLMLKYGVTRVRMVATSATRDASNREDFFTMTGEELGRVVAGAQAEVITGDEEARLSFAGAVGELSSAAGPFVVVDLGGGSTEVVLGDANGVQSAYSADIGCVRITERCLHGNPPTREEVAAARFFASERLAQAFGVVPVERAHTWVGVAGTMTTIAAVALDLPEYDSERVHLTRLPLSELRAVCDRLIGMNHDQRAALGPMHPGRVDVIGGGAVVAEVLADELARRAGIGELIVSEHDILDGIALSIA